MFERLRQRWRDRARRRRRGPRRFFRPRIEQAEDRRLLAGVLLTESTPSTALVEGGPVDSYQLALDTPPTGDVTVTVAAPGDLQVSSDGSTFSSNLGLTFSSTTPQTVFVRAVDDPVVELARLVTIDHTVTATADAVNYPLTTAIPGLSVSLADNDAATIDLNGGTADETAGPVTFSVTLSRPVEIDVTVTFATRTTGTATAGEFTAVPGQVVTFLAGTTTPQVVSVTIVDDALVEVAETIDALIDSLSAGGRNVTLGAATASATITNDDQAQLSLSAANTAESSGALLFTVSLSAAVDVATTVRFDTRADGTAFPGLDFVPVEGLEVTFPAGSTAAQAVTVAVANDNVVEAAETIVGQLSSPSANGRDVELATLAATGTVMNDDSATVDLAGASAAEAAGELAFAVTLSNPVDAPVTVQFDAPTGGTDFVAVTALSVTFAAGSTSQSVLVTVNNDSVVEADETVNAVLSNVVTGRAGVSVGTATPGTIENDDSATLTLSGSSALESTMSVAFELTLSAPVDVPVLVELSTLSTGTATPATDFVALAGRVVSFAAGTTTQTVAVTVTNENTVELSETIDASLANLTTNGRDVAFATPTATSTITNDDQAQLSLSAASPAESSGALLFTVSLSAAVDVATTVRFDTRADGTAFPGLDFVPVEGLEVTFPAGSTAAQAVTVAVANDNIVEAAETIAGQLSSPSASGRDVELATLAATGTVTNDDSATVDLAGASAAEAAGELAFAVTLSNPVDAPVTVQFDAPTGGTDFVAVTALSVTFAAGSTSQSVLVTVNNDSVVEADETVNAVLSNVVTGRAGVTVGTATPGTIENDDSATLTLSGSSALEGTMSVAFELTLSAPVDVPVLVELSTLSTGTATPATDFVALAGRVVTFTAGTTTQTVAVTVTNESTVELSETIDASLANLTTNGRDVAFATPTATSTIANDDQATLSLSAASPAESSGALLFTVSLSAAVDVATTVRFDTRADGTAFPGLDFVPVEGLEVTFPAGSTAAQAVTVAVANDNVVEADETIAGQLSSPSANGRDVELATLAATGMVMNDDSATVDLAGASAAEAAGELAFAVTLSNPVDAPVTVQFDAPTGGTDFVAVTARSVTFAAGSTSQLVLVTVNNDSVVEADETVNAVLSNVVTGRAGVTVGTATPGTIENDDSATLTLSGSSALEGTMSVSFELRLSAPVDVPVLVELSTLSTGTATPATDFVALAGRVVQFMEGTTTQTVAVTVTNESTVEMSETIDASLANLTTNGRDVAFATPTATSTIANDDQATLSLAAATASESAAALNFTVGLTNPVDVPVTVVFDTLSTGSATSGADFTPLAGQVVTFTAGSTTAQVIVLPVVVESLVEANETVNGGLSGLTASGRAVMLGTPSAAGTITNDDSATIRITAGSAPEDAGRLDFLVHLSAPVDVPVTVMFETMSGTATAGSDFVPVAGLNLLFPAGSTESRIVAIDLLPDRVVELAETIVGQLSALVTGGRDVMLPAASSAATGTIANDDSAIVQIAGASASEAAGAIAFTVTLSNPADVDVSVAFDTQAGTATTPDFTAITGRRLTFAAGTATPQTVTVAVTNETLVELDETFTAMLSALANDGRSVTLGTSIATGTIVNDDSATVSLTGMTAPEANALVFTVALTNPVDVLVTASFSTPTTGTATAGDFTAVGQSLTFAAGSAATQSVTVPVVSDNVVELDETVVAVLSAFSAGGRNVTLANASATGTIANDDRATISLSGATASESAGALVFTATLTSPVDVAVALDFETLPVGSATSGVDFAAIAGRTLTFTALSTTAQTVTVTVVDDIVVEADESVPARLSGLSASGRAVTLVTPGATSTITNDDSATVGLVAGQAPENAGRLDVRVTLSAPVDVPVAVRFDTLTSGTATSGVDFVPAGLVVAFAAGSTAAQTLAIDVLPDHLVELDETIVGQLSGLAASGRNVLLAATPSATGTIANDDAATVNVASTTAVEAAGALAFVVTLTNPADVAVTVAFDTLSGAAAGTATPGTDFVALASRAVTFAAGSNAAQTITVTVSDENIVELDETVIGQIGTLSAGGRAVTVGSSTATGTIANDDSAVVSLADVTAAESSARLTFTIQLSNPVDVPVTLAFDTGTGTTGTGTATPASDFTAIVGQVVTFMANSTTAQTVDVTVVDEAIVELDETVAARLRALNAGGRAVSFAIAEATGTIANDDQATVQLTSVTIDENAGPLNFTARLSGPVDVPVVVRFDTLADGTALTGSDFLPISGHVVTFPAGAASDQVVAVAVVPDLLVELDETVVAQLANLAAGGRSVAFAGPRATGTLRNDDQATLQVDDVTAAESAGRLTFVVSLSGPADVPVTVQFDTLVPGAGTATPGADFTAIAGRQITFPAGQSGTQSVEVAVIDERLVEADETLAVRLSGALPARAVTFARSDATGTITNDDSATISLLATTAREASGSLAFTVTLSDPVDTAVSVTLDTLTGTATANQDYTPLTGLVVSFAPASTAPQTVTVAVTNDTVVEAEETIPAQLANLLPANRAVSLLTAEATGTITDNDTATLTITAVSSVEGSSAMAAITPFEFVVELSNAVQGGLRVSAATSDGVLRDVDGDGVADTVEDDGKAATAADDFNALAQTLTFTGAEAETRVVSVSVRADERFELDESFEVVLSNALPLAAGIEAGRVTLAVARATGTIRNDDNAIVETGGSGDDTLAIFATGRAEGRFVLTRGGRVGPSIHFTGVTQVTFRGLDGSDTFYLEPPTSEPFAPVGGLRFEGGAAADQLTIASGTATELTVAHARAGEGSVTWDGTPLGFVGVESADLGLASARLAQQFGDSAETITVTDAGGGRTRVASTASAAVTFVSPSDRLALNGGMTGRNTIAVRGLASDFDGTLAINGRATEDVVDFSAAVGLESLAIESATIRLASPSLVTTQDQTFTGKLSLTGDVAVTAQSVAFGGTIDGQRTLTVTSAGAVQFGDAIGSQRPLAGLVVRAESTALPAVTTREGGIDVAISGTQPIGLSGPLTTAGSGAARGGPIRFEGPVRLDADVTLSTVHAAGSDGDVTFAGATSTIAGAGLTILAGDGRIGLDGAVDVSAARIEGLNLDLVTTLTGRTGVTLVGQGVRGDGSITLGPGAVVSADNAGMVELTAGDRILVDVGATLGRAANRLTLTVDPDGTNGSNDAAGGTVELRGTVTGGTLVIQGGPDDDVLRLDGLQNVPTLTGDATTVGGHTNTAFAASGLAPAIVAAHFEGGGGDDTLELSSGLAVSYFADAASTAGGVLVIPQRLALSSDDVEALVLAGSSSASLVLDATAAGASRLTVNDFGVATDGENEATADRGWQSVRFRGFDPVTLRAGAGSQTVTLESLDAADPDGSGRGRALRQLTLDAGAAADTFVLQSVPAGVTVTAVGGAGDDTFTIDSNGADAGGTANEVRGMIVVRGGGTPLDGAVDLLTVVDLDELQENDWHLSGSQLGGGTIGGVLPGGPFGATGRLEFNGLEGLTLRASEQSVSRYSFGAVRLDEVLPVVANNNAGRVGLMVQDGGNDSTWTVQVDSLLPNVPHTFSGGRGADDWRLVIADGVAPNANVQLSIDGGEEGDATDIDVVRLDLSADSEPDDLNRPGVLLRRDVELEYAATAGGTNYGEDATLSVGETAPFAVNVMGTERFVLSAKINRADERLYDRLVVRGAPNQDNVIRLRESGTGTPQTHEIETRGFDSLFLLGGTGRDEIVNDTSVPALIVGGAGDDRLIGGSAADAIFAGLGADVLRGMGGDDFLFADVTFANDLVGAASARLEFDHGDPAGRGDILEGGAGRNSGVQFGGRDTATGMTGQFLNGALVGGAPVNVLAWLQAQLVRPEDRGQFAGRTAELVALAFAGLDRLDVRYEPRTVAAPAPATNAVLAQAVVPEAESEAAAASAFDPLDRNGDGLLQPIDVLLAINELNRRGAGAPVDSNDPRDRRWDTDGNGWLAARDVLMVLNELNQRALQRPAEGEPPGLVFAVRRSKQAGQTLHGYTV